MSWSLYALWDRRVNTSGWLRVKLARGHALTISEPIEGVSWRMVHWGRLHLYLKYWSKP